MAEGGKSGKTMAAVIDITGTINPALGKSIASAQKQISGLGANFKAMWAALPLAALAAGAAGLAVMGAAAYKAGSQLYEMGKEWKEARNNIRIGTGATGEQLAKLEKSFENVYAQFEGSKDLISSTIADLNTLTDLEGKPLEDYAMAVLDAADMLKIDTKALSETTAGAFKAFNVEGDQMAGTMDWLWKVSQSTGVKLDTLAATVRDNATAFIDLGIDLEHASAMVGQLSKQGVEAQPVLAGMKKAMSNLIKQGSKDPRAHLAAMVNQIKNLKDETKAGAKAAELFGDKNARVMVRGLRSGKIAVDSLVQALKTSKETIGSAGDDTEMVHDRIVQFGHKTEIALKPLSEEIYKIFDGLSPFLQKLAEEILPVLREQAELAAPEVREFGEKMKEYLKNIDWEDVRKKTVMLFNTLKDGVVMVHDVVNGLLKLLKPIMNMVEFYDGLSGNQWKSAYEKEYGKENAEQNKAYQEEYKRQQESLGANDEERKLNAKRLQELKDRADELRNYADTSKRLSEEQKKYVQETAKYLEETAKTFDSSAEQMARYRDAMTRVEQVYGISKANASGTPAALPALASGGFTEGLSFAGEAGQEAVISFDPRYREANRGYVMQAAEMLDMTAAATPERQSVAAYNLGGLTFSPVIHAGDGTNEKRIVDRIRALVPEILDMIEEGLQQRERTRYGV